MFNKLSARELMDDSEASNINLKWHQKTLQHF